jgi:hypothetical protein
LYFWSDYVDDLKVGFKKVEWGEMETSPLFISEINQRVGGPNPLMGEKGKREQSPQIAAATLDPEFSMRFVCLRQWSSFEPGFFPLWDSIIFSNSSMPTFPHLAQR